MANRLLAKALRKSQSISVQTRYNRSPVCLLHSFQRHFSSSHCHHLHHLLLKLLFLERISLRFISFASGLSYLPERQSGRWSRWLLFLPGAVTLGLGTGQIFRRQQEMKMIEYRKKRLELEPVVLNSISPSDEDWKSLEFRRVVCEGFVDATKSVYIEPQSRNISGMTENGYCIVTPLILTSNKPDSVQLPVLVNRGWVLRNWRDKPVEDSHDKEKSSSVTSQSIKENEGSFWRRLWSKKPKEAKEEEPAVAPVRVISVVRGSEKPSIFVPASPGRWFYVDVPAIAHSAGLPKDGPLYIEDTNEDVYASRPYPIPEDVNTLTCYSVMPQDHLNYASTWFASRSLILELDMR